MLAPAEPVPGNLQDANPAATFHAVVSCQSVDDSGAPVLASVRTPLYILPVQPQSNPVDVDLTGELEQGVGIAAGAFAVSFAVPAAALKALALEKPVIAVGDVLSYADATTGGQPGQPFKAADLPVNSSVQLFPMGKESNEDNLVHVVRIAPGDGVAGLVAYSAICTHLGCAVKEKLNRDNLILCPCHGSIYDPANHAAVRRGPSDRALPGIPVADGPDGTVIANGPFDGPIGPQ